jgi:hypothetical protein
MCRPPRHRAQHCAGTARTLPGRRRCPPRTRSGSGGPVPVQTWADMTPPRIPGCLCVARLPHQVAGDAGPSVQVGGDLVALHTVGRQQHPPVPFGQAGEVHAAYANEILGRGGITPRRLVRLWMHSDAHRAVLGSGQPRRLGVGAVLDQYGPVTTANLCGSSPQHADPSDTGAARHKSPSQGEPRHHDYAHRVIGTRASIGTARRAR